MPWWLPFGRVPGVAPGVLAEQLERGDVQILDVRSAVEWRLSHIQGAINVPLQTLRGALPALPLDPERPVAAICLSAHRSIPAVRLLRENGFADVRQLEGGMLAWWRAGLPTESG